jgi:hypothetical protein
MQLPKLSLGRLRPAQAPLSPVAEDHFRLRPATDGLPLPPWQGHGYVTCGDGVTTPITDICGESLSDGRFLACTRGAAICSNRGGISECDGMLMPFVPCRG